MAEYNPSKIIKDGNTYNFRDTTKIPLVGSNEISGSLVPSTDGTVNLGSSTAQWNNAYIKSLTINGTQFLPSDYATLSGLSTVATSGSYNDLSNKPTIPTVNNGALTIQQNGTTVDTFTANSSSDKTVNIQCVDLTNNQTVAGNKEFTGTTTAHDVIPSATDTYNLGSSTAQWNNAYIKSLTINGVACGDILTHNVSEFVGVTGAQTIGGEKTFSNLRTYFGRDISCYSTRKYGKNLNPTSNTYQYLNFSGNTVSEGATNDWSSGYLEQVVDTNGGSRGRWFIQDTSENPVGVELWVSGNDKQFRPYQNNTTDLGTATKKWKSFNGINPSALSLPSTLLSAMIRIDTTSWVLDGETDVEYTPLGDGYLTLTNNQNLEWIKGQIPNDNNFGIYRFVYKYDSDMGGIQGVTIPCIKDKKVIMKIKGTGFYNALFTYCQGNV